MRTYNELITLPTLEDRFNYLRCNSRIGNPTFGSDRWVNQEFYKSPIWTSFRNRIIVRDNGNDMALPGREIPDYSMIVIHHIEPITVEDILEMRPCVLDPNNVVCVSNFTHRAIHYGTLESIGVILGLPNERTPNDMCPWK